MSILRLQVAYLGVSSILDAFVILAFDPTNIRYNSFFFQVQLEYTKY